jgi:hypothetical protein
LQGGVEWTIEGATLTMLGFRAMRSSFVFRIARCGRPARTKGSYPTTRDRANPSRFADDG